MTPTEQYVDPSVLFEELRIAQVGEEAAAEMDPYRFGPGVFIKGRIDEFCALLNKQGADDKKTPTFGQLAWPQLTESEQQLVETLAESGESSETDLKESPGCDLQSSLASDTAFLEALYDPQSEKLVVRTRG